MIDIIKSHSAEVIHIFGGIRRGLVIMAVIVK